MKAIVFGMLFLGLTSLGYAQELNKEANEDETQEVVLEGVTVTALNMDYLEKVHDKATPEVVKELEHKAARFKIKGTPIYFSEVGPYEVHFSNSKGNIIATYNRKGKILVSSEKFKDVVLPLEVRNSVYREYPDWKINSNVYLVSYHHNKGVKKIYQFQIGKDNDKRNLRTDVAGNILN